MDAQESGTNRQTDTLPAHLRASQKAHWCDQTEKEDRSEFELSFSQRPLSQRVTLKGDKAFESDSEHLYYKERLAKGMFKVKTNRRDGVKSTDYLNEENRRLYREQAYKDSIKRTSHFEKT